MSQIPAWLHKEIDDYFVAPFSFTPEVIVDIGANIGAFALRARQQWPRAWIICYEPIPSNVTALRQNIEADQQSARISIMPYAVRSEAGQEEIWLGKLFVGNSFTQQEWTTGNRILVDCVAARDVPACDLLKIDTEGCEVEILSNMDLTGVNAILLEFHSKADHAELHRLLDPQFKCLADEPGKEVGTMIFERR
jgi:FkbM family methyltransferase